MNQKSLTIDEFSLLTVGYTYLKTGNLFEVGQPPLTFTLSAFPLLLLDIKIPSDYYQYYLENKYEDYSYEFYYNYNKDIMEKIVFLARIPIILMSLLLGFYVFRFAKELYGKNAGLFALFLYSFSPNILAHSRLVTTHLGNACFTFIALYYFWRFINNKTSKNLILAGIIFGLAQITKFTALALIPIYIILFVAIIYCKRKNLKELFSKKTFKKLCTMFYSLFVIVIIGFVIINLSYGFNGSFKSLGKNLEKDESRYFDHNVYNADALANNLIPFENNIIRKSAYFVMNNIPLIIPYPYLKSIVGVNKVASATATSHQYFIGRYLANTDIWYSYIVMFLIKTPIPTILLLFLTLIFFKRIRNKNILNEYFLIIPIMFFIIYFSFLFPLKTTLMYILPIYPFIFVFISKIINLKIKKQQVLCLVFIILGGWYLFSSLSIYPHYLAYFNEFVGGPDNGYKYLINANLDWGQDLKGLEKYLKKNNIEKINIAYHGNGYLDIETNFLKYYQNDTIQNCSPQTGIVAISASYLQGMLLDDRTCFQWLKKYEPIKKIGYTIFVYNITE